MGENRTETDQRSEGSVPRQLSSDVKELIEHYHTTRQTVNNLLSGGVKFDDLADVLEMRDGLSTQEFITEERQGQTVDRTKTDIVSAESIARAYRAVNGDLEELERLVDKTIADSGGTNDYGALKLGLHTRTLNHVVDLYQDGELKAIFD